MGCVTDSGQMKGLRLTNRVIQQNRSWEHERSQSQTGGVLPCSPDPCSLQPEGREGGREGEREGGREGGREKGRKGRREKGREREREGGREREKINTSGTAIRNETV